MILFQKYLICVLLPSILIILSRWLFAFYFPINLGIHFAGFISHRPIVPSQKALRIFNNTSAALFLAFSIILILITGLPFANYFHYINLNTNHIVALIKAAIPIYAIWFLNSFATGYMYGDSFYDEFFIPNPITKFFFHTLDECSKGITELPRHVFQRIGLLFDNEKKIAKRIEIHRSIIKSYKKEHNKQAVEILSGAIKMNEEEIKNMKELRKKHGHLSVFWFNFKESFSKLIFSFLIPPVFLYMVLVESFISIFPSLTKMWEARDNS